MNSTNAILIFLGLIAQIRMLFRETHIIAQSSKSLHDVTTEVIPFKGETSEYAIEGVTLTIALNAELNRPVTASQKAIGMSLLLRNTSSGWCAEAEVGWTGDLIGWDPFSEKIVEKLSFDEMVECLPELVKWMRGEFEGKLENLD